MVMYLIENGKICPVVFKIPIPFVNIGPDLEQDISFLIIFLILCTIKFLVVS